MPVEILPQLLQYALAVISALLALLIALIVYVFLSLKSDVRRVQETVGEQGQRQAKLVHKAECREVEDAINDRIDKHENQLSDHSTRLVRLETKLDVRGQHEHA